MKKNNNYNVNYILTGWDNERLSVQLFRTLRQNLHDDDDEHGFHTFIHKRKLGNDGGDRMVIMYSL